MADAVNTYQEEPAESQEHVEAMLAKVEGTQVDPERPEWLPEKFKSPEEMAKAYSSLESKLGQSSSEETASEIEEAELEEVTNQSASEVSDLLDSRGLDFDVFQEEYMQTGTLSPEAYEALEEAGLSETLVDTWIQGQNALANQVTSQMQSLVGGAEEYGQLVQWASDNLPEGEVDAYNQVMESQDPDLIRLAVQGLNARYRSEAAPNLIEGSTGAVSTGGKFSSNAELTAAMGDPRYAKDSAYRQQVADKLARSSLF